MPTVITQPSKIKPEAKQGDSQHAAESQSDLFSLFRNSRLPIVAKWSFAISILVITVMGLLGWVLITQQTASFMRQTEEFGRILVEQLAHSASEPIMAEDNFILAGLVSRQIESAQVLGAAIQEKNSIQVKAGITPPLSQQLISKQDQPRQISWSWFDENGRARKAITFSAPIRFKDVTAGHALITLDRDQLDRELKEAIYALAYTTVGLILLGIAMAYALGRRLSRPIQELAEAGETLSEGKQILGVDRRRRDEIGQIIGSFNLMLDGMREKDRVERALSSYISPHAASRVLANLEQPDNAGEQVFGSVLFCDIVGYTQLTEGMSPRAVAEMLNEYLGYIALAGHSCQGMVDKFIGDSVMVVFGAPESDEHHALHAVTCGVMIQGIVQQINQRRLCKQLQPLHFRIGINSGEMMAGNIGIQERMQYTVVGDTVNLGARLCSTTRPNTIMIGAETARQPEVADKVILNEQPSIRVKGRNQPVTPYLVTSMTPVHQQQVQLAMEQLLPIANRT